MMHNSAMKIRVSPFFPAQSLREFLRELFGSSVKGAPARKFETDLVISIPGRGPARLDLARPLFDRCQPGTRPHPARSCSPSKVIQFIGLLQIRIRRQWHPYLDMRRRPDAPANSGHARVTFASCFPRDSAPPSASHASRGRTLKCDSIPAAFLCRAGGLTMPDQQVSSVYARVAPIVRELAERKPDCECALYIVYVVRYTSFSAECCRGIYWRISQLLQCAGKGVRVRTCPPHFPLSRDRVEHPIIDIPHSHCNSRKKGTQFFLWPEHCNGTTLVCVLRLRKRTS